MREKRRPAAALAGLAALLLAACGGGAATSGGQPSGNLVIVTQPDLGYAPLQIVDAAGWLKADLPKVNVEWKELNSGSAIQAGMLSGTIDVGAGGIAPFVLGYSKGVDWRLLSSLDDMDLWLVCKPSIHSLKDIKPGDKISVVAPTSIQAIVLKKGAQQELGNPNALDANLVIQPHPVAYQSFLTGTIACDLGALPFQQEEVAHGGRKVWSSFQAFGPSTFNGVFVMRSFYGSHTREMQILFNDIQRAIKLLNDDPRQAAQYVAQYNKGQMTADQAYALIKAPGVSWTNVPHGYVEYARFMKSAGLIDKVPGSWKELVFPNLRSVSGS
jgi:NitT/TauT family transport system substrate-binding protein